jgi:hypothetical protein
MGGGGWLGFAVTGCVRPAVALKISSRSPWAIIPFGTSGTLGAASSCRGCELPLNHWRQERGAEIERQAGQPIRGGDRRKHGTDRSDSPAGFCKMDDVKRQRAGGASGRIEIVPRTPSRTFGPSRLIDTLRARPADLRRETADCAAQLAKSSLAGHTATIYAPDPRPISPAVRPGTSDTLFMIVGHVWSGRQALRVGFGLCRGFPARFLDIYGDTLGRIN